MSSNDRSSRDSDEPVSDMGDAAPDEPNLKTLLRRAMPEHAPDHDVLSAVQRKLRLRSGGKFYADGWSVVKHPPISTYLITSVFMLAAVIALYAALFSFSGSVVEVNATPEPVRVVPPP